MKRISYEEFREQYNPWIRDDVVEINRENGFHPYVTTVSELRERGFGTLCGDPGNSAFEATSVDAEVVAALDVDSRELAGGIFWAGFDSLDGAEKFSDEIRAGGGSARLDGEYADGFLFEVE